LVRHPQFVNPECFLHALLQASRRARIQGHRLGVQLGQRPYKIRTGTPDCSWS
jgi:hypothetical protein